MKVVETRADWQSVIDAAIAAAQPPSDELCQLVANLLGPVPLTAGGEHDRPR